MLQELAPKLFDTVVYGEFKTRVPGVTGDLLSYHIREYLGVPGLCSGVLPFEYYMNIGYAVVNLFEPGDPVDYKRAVCCG